MKSCVCFHNKNASHIKLHLQSGTVDCLLNVTTQKWKMFNKQYRLCRKSNKLLSKWLGPSVIETKGPIEWRSRLHLEIFKMQIFYATMKEMYMNVINRGSVECKCSPSLVFIVVICWYSVVQCDAIRYEYAIKS